MKKFSEFIKFHLDDGYVVFGKLKKEYLTKFDFDGKKQLGWSRDKKKAQIFPDKGSAEKALDMTLGTKYGTVLSEGMQVANTIKKQLGNKALVMIGAKNLAGGDKYLSFRIGRNSKGVNYVKITLTSMDLYDVEFGAIRGTNYKVKKEVKGIYADQLHKAIEDNTGMYTSLGTMGR